MSLTWANCTANDPPNLSCATLRVPADWSYPNAEQITITMAKLSAVDTRNRIGSMLFNPGGPGEVVVETLYGLALAAQGNATIFPPQFDIIGADPRGVGYSQPLRCDPQLWNKVVSKEPTDEAGFQALATYNHHLGQSCRDLTGPMFDHMDTRSIAMDFEAIRVALNEGNLTYLGLSYGSVIGEAYAEMYPQNIRAFALDAVVDHSLSPISSLAIKAYTYENEFNRFAAWCAATPSCVLHGENVTDVFVKLIAKAKQTPISAPACNASQACQSSVTAFDIRYNLQNYLLFKDGSKTLGLPSWNDAAAALGQAAAGNATLLSPQRANSTNSTVFGSSGLGTLCLDWNRTADNLAGVRYLEMLTNDIAPLTGGVSNQLYLQTSCINWPAGVQYAPQPVNVTNAPPMLFTNSYHDPEVSYVEANDVMGQFNGSVLATRNGDGHTSYFLLGETYEAINKYLVTLELPAPNTVFSS